MKITVKFYSLFKSLAGVDKVKMEIEDGYTIEDLLPLLGDKFKKLPLEKEHISFLVNERIAKRDQVLVQEDEVTIFEMFAGG